MPLFGQHKPSDEIINITTYDDKSELASNPITNRYTTLSNRRLDVNSSAISKGYSDNSELPEITNLKDSVVIMPPHSQAMLDTNREQDEFNQNMERLKRIRNSVRSVDQFNPIKRKRLYQGIVIISKQEFFIDIFKTKTKFYISAIELSSKTPHMVELYLNQGKKLLRECNDNFDDLVMRLEFKFGKLAIHDMNKLLYQDYTSFATSPRSPSGGTNKKATHVQKASQKYTEYFKHRPKSLATAKHVERKSFNIGSIHVKPKLTLNKDSDTGEILTQITNLMSK